MPGSKVTRSALFSFRTPEQRIPAAHRLLKSRVPINGVVVSLHWGLVRLYEKDALLGYRSRIFRPGNVEVIERVDGELVRFRFDSVTALARHLPRKLRRLPPR